MQQLNVVKAISEDHGRILEEVGATDIIFPEKDMAVRTARNLSAPNIIEQIPLGDDFASPRSHRRASSSAKA